jgi:hypothetical protein
VSRATEHEDEARLARSYDETRDLSGFDEGLSEPVEVRRNVTISVRFSEDEIAALRDQANEAGLKVTALIRAAALRQVGSVDLAAAEAAIEKASAQVNRAGRLLKAMQLPTAAPSP